MSDPDKLKIREYRHDDAQAAIELVREMQIAETPFDRHMKPVADVGQWYVDNMITAAASEAGVILVAELQGVCVGLACLLTHVADAGIEELSPHVTAHINELVVAKSVRGQGIGQKLLDECEYRARLAGRDEITLAVYAQNAPAHGLYLRAGYRDRKIRMVKKLA